MGCVLGHSKNNNYRRKKNNNSDKILNNVFSKSSEYISDEIPNYDSTENSFDIFDKSIDLSKLNISESKPASPSPQINNNYF